MISSHAVTFRLPPLWKPLTDIAAGAVLQSNKRSQEAHDVRMREKGQSCSPQIYPEERHCLMAIFSREYPHAVSSRPNALSKTPSRRLLQGPFSSASAVPEGQGCAVEGPELRPQVHPDAGRWAMASFFREYPHAVSSRPNALSKTPSRRLRQGPFFSGSAVPEGQGSAVEGPELRPQVPPDGGRWAMASFFSGVPP